MFRAALCTIDNVWNQPKCPSTGEQVKTTWCICSVEHHSSIKCKEIMPCTATWMDLEIVIGSVASASVQWLSRVQLFVTP